MKSNLRFLFEKKSTTIVRDINLTYKSIGYFPFLMMPLIYLKDDYSSLSFFNSKKWSRMLNAILDKGMLDVYISEYKYGTNYNLSIFEIFSIYQKYNIDFSKELLLKQIETINSQSGFCKNLSMLKSYELNFFK